MASVNQVTAELPESHDRQAEISAILQVVRRMRDDTAELELSFEAYLLDMAVLALNDHLDSAS